MPPHPEPTPQFRGTWTPAELHFMVRDGLVDLTEAWLLLTIDSLTTPRGVGCFASNAWLAKSIRRTPRHVAKMLAKLKAMGLLLQQEETPPKYAKPRRTLRVVYTCSSVAHDTGGVSPMTPKSISSLRSEIQEENPSSRNRLDRDLDVLLEKPPTGESPVFQGFPDPPDDKIKVHHLARADVLRAATVENGYKLRWNRKKWADQFRLLENDLREGRITGLTADDVLPVLRWFEGVAKEKKVKVMNAQHFRRTFVHLHRMMKSVKPVVKVTDKAKAIADQFRGRFSNYKWPKGSGDQLDAFVQLTLDAAKAFQERLKFVAVSDHKTNKENMAAMLLRSRFMYFDHPDTFTEKWTQAVYDDIKDWSGWSGNLTSMAFTGDLNQKRMDRLGKQWATDYYGSDREWTKLKESLS